MARRFGRRRRPRVVWLPPVGTQINTGLTPGNQYAGGFFTGLVLAGANHNPTVEFPLVTDSPDPVGAVGNLTQWQQQALASAQDIGYRLRRIVGKLHIGVEAHTGGQTPTIDPFWSVTAGFIVRRVDETGNAIATADQLSTQSVQNLQDPWIWRRNWILSTGVAGGGSNAAMQLFPRNTALYGGGNNDACHVDQKTARIVGPEERLFLNVSFVTGGQLEGQDEVESDIFVGIHYDLRILASLRTNTGNRRNAAR